MTVSLTFYSDSGLTTFATSITALQASDGSAAAEDRVVYLGSTVSGNKFRATSDPGVDQIVLSIVDAASGSGVEATHVKLATTSGGLGSALGGQALALGTQLLSGVANAQPIYVRIDTPALAVGVYSEITLSLNGVTEEAV